jgi:replication factor A1
MTYQLSAGSCVKLLSARSDDASVFESQHTMQFLSFKKVSPTTSSAGVTTPERYRIIMSDGINYMQAMLATQLNNLVTDNIVGKNCIALVDKLTCNYVQEKRYASLLQ